MLYSNNRNFLSLVRLLSPSTRNNDWDNLGTIHSELCVSELLNGLWMSRSRRLFSFSLQMLGSRIEAMLEQETANGNNVSMVTDEAKQRQLLTEDEDEDFLDEGTNTYKMSPVGNGSDYILFHIYELT